MMPRMLLALFCGFALAASPVLAADARLTAAWDRGPERAELIHELVADNDLSDHELAEAMLSPDWRVRQQAAVVHGWRQHPELYQRFAVEQAAPTRAGMLRFRGPDLADTRLAPLFLERLLQGPDSSYQEALIEVLPRTGGDWGDAFVGLFREEQDARVRSVLVASMRQAPREPAVSGIRLGLTDVSAEVRGEAARAAGWSEHGLELVADLVDTLPDQAPYTRAMAVRSLGYLRATQAFDALLPLLADSDPQVRLNAINALERLDAERLAQRPELGSLAHDADPRVVRAALRVR